MSGFLIKYGDSVIIIRDTYLDICIRNLQSTPSSIVGADTIFNKIYDNESSVYVEGTTYDKVLQLIKNSDTRKLLLPMWDTFKSYEKKNNRIDKIERIKTLISAL